MNLRKSLVRASKLALVAVVAVPAMAMSMPALAATTSEGSVELKASTKGVTPVNPVDPTDPTDPTDPGGDIDPVDPVPGLNFIYVSNFDFGQNDIDTSAEMKLYDGKVGVNSANVQVLDARGAGSGWKLSADMSDFTDGTNNSLDGSYITLKSGLSKQDPNNSYGSAPSLTTAASTVLSAGGSSVDIASATRGNAQGLSLLVWQDGTVGEGTDTTRTWDGTAQAVEKRNNNVELTIPRGAATAGSHKTTITWTLADII